MLSKILKYDLRQALRGMMPFYLFVLFFALCVRILDLFEPTPAIDTLSEFSVGALFAMIANTVANSVIRTWARFKQTVYGDQAYLTHTLPATKNEIFQAKFIGVMIVLLVGFIASAAGLAIAFLGAGAGEQLGELIEIGAQSANLSAGWLVGLCGLILFIEVANVIACGLLGIIFGYRKNDQKGGFSLLFGFLTYILAQALVLGAILAVGVFNSEIMGAFRATEEAFLSAGTIKAIAGVSGAVYLIIIAGINLVCTKTLKRGVDVE